MVLTLQELKAGYMEILSASKYALQRINANTGNTYIGVIGCKIVFK